ncbi:MAG: hypothetical protein SGI77_04645 [Pirellulaceae bacterium]|nr:hypothetical protein [Pirellulaceae bacterium]
MNEQSPEQNSLVELAISFKSPDSNTLDRIGRIKILNNRKIELGQLKGPQAGRLREVLKEMQNEEVLEVDVEDQITDDAGNAIYVNKTKLVDKGDPLFVPAVRQYLRLKRFVVKPVKAKK